MGAREHTIYVDKPDGSGQLAIGPDDEIPTWASKLIHPRHTEEAGSDGPPPQSGKGSGKDAWLSYAEANDVEVAADATKDDIIAACEDAGVPVE